MAKVYCGKCDQMLPVESFSKDKSKRLGLKSSCKGCSSKSYKKWVSENADHKSEYRKKWISDNPDIRAAGKLRYTKKNREKVLAYAKKYKQNNPARVALLTKRRRKVRKERTPHWLTKSQWDEMNSVYSRSRKLTEDTGIIHQVDHIIPLNGELVSGLHVPWNLQILTADANRKKSNKWQVTT